jgi:tetratricopeptide (TPR) repeat protein
MPAPRRPEITLGDRRGQAITLNNMGTVYLDLGDFKKARQNLENAGKVILKIKDKEIRRRIAVSLCELMIAEMKEKGMERARIYVEEALRLAEVQKLKAGRAEALLLQARIEAANGIKSSLSIPPLLKGDKGDFNGKFKEAISVFEALKQPFDLARVYYYYAKSIGQRAESEKYLKKASDIFKKLGAKGWLAKIRMTLPQNMIK